MIHRVVVVCGVIALGCLVTGACSEFKPGSYEGGGRSQGPIIVGGAGSGCGALGSQCQSSDDCCSHVCAFSGQLLTCAASDDASGTCAAINAGCQIDSDCCSSFCSPGKLCATPPPPQDSGGGG